MIKFKTVLFATALLVGTASAADVQTAACNPQLAKVSTEFPAAARDGGHHGTAVVALTLTADGRATDTQIQQSSGSRLLDQAAVDSVREHWRFAVANCSAAELAIPRSVEVRFVRTPKTVFGTVNRAAPVEARELLARNRCDVARETTDTTVYSCVKNSPSELAARAQASVEH